MASLAGLTSALWAAYMKAVLCVLLCMIVTLNPGCTSWGGGGGQYYGLETAFNLHGITKLPLSDSVAAGVGARIAIDDPGKVSYPDAVRIAGSKYYSFREVSFNASPYRIAIPLRHWVSIVNSENEIIRKLATPRYARDALALELCCSAGSYLAILIEQQSTSHSSTLYILDAELKPIYKEHLLGAKWIAKQSGSHGDSLLVSSEDFWFPHGHDVPNSRVAVQGNWLYRFQHQSGAVAEGER